jgi:hypothetical protein
MEEKTGSKNEIEELNIEPLSDEDLDSVAGGAEESCSCCGPNSGCTSVGKSSCVACDSELQ